MSTLTTHPQRAKTRQHLPPIAVEDVRPAVDGGRYPVKRLLGEAIAVEATAYREGHDLIAGRVVYRGPDDAKWRASPMVYARDFDRLRGEFVVDRIGVWTFGVEAWTDRYATWRAELEKKVAAGVDVGSELVEGAALVAEAAEASPDRVREVLERAAKRMRQSDRPLSERVAIASGADLRDFVHRYLPCSDLTRADGARTVVVDPPIAGFASWYEMFPRSQGAVAGEHATFEQAAAQLPRVAELGFDVVYLPPIHPIGRTHRKGKDNTLQAGPDDPGSPWAIGGVEGGHTAIEPRLGTVRDFERFVQRAGELGMAVALDYALQCSPDHPWVTEHPEWFFIRPDGTIKYAENPPKKYEDIYPLNLWCDGYQALWDACRDIFLYWIERGVKIFRVDNPHTKPFAFWEWVIGEVKRDHPEVVFLSEAFTRPARMKGLAKRGFSQSYTYFTWRNSAWDLREYLTELTQTDMVEYFRPNFFVNTPDILHEYLQSGGRPAFLVRLVLAGTLAPLYGMYSGFELCENVPVRSGSEEYLHSEKYEIRVRDWNAPGNINAEIARLNEIRREHPALQRLDDLTFCPSENEQILFYHKHAPDDDLLIAVNLDPHHAQATIVQVPLEALGFAPDTPFVVEDLLTGIRYTWRGVSNYVRLDPRERVAHVLHVEHPGVRGADA